MLDEEHGAERNSAPWGNRQNVVLPTSQARSPKQANLPSAQSCRDLLVLVRACERDASDADPASMAFAGLDLSLQVSAVTCLAAWPDISMPLLLVLIPAEHKYASSGVLPVLISTVFIIIVRPCGQNARPT